MSKTYIGYRALGFGFDAHLTMTYLGEMTESQEDEVYEILSTLSKQSHTVTRGSLALFGPNKDIPVVTVIPGIDLWHLRKILDKLIPSKSEYEWNPHITLKFDSSYDLHIPRQIELTKLDLY